MESASRRDARTEPIPLTREGVEAAHEALREHLFESPLLPSPALGELTGAEIYLKAENIQRTGSFKVRGSVNKLRKLVENAHGAIPEVTAASAGNHAQGVAYAAGRLGIRSTIFMPRDAPVAKKRATRELGARVRLQGRNYDEARAASLEYAENKGAVFVDGFDDWDIIEGQGTIGVELAGRLGDRPPDYVLIPAGGGGLLAGILFYLRQVYGDAPKIIGVQSERAPALHDSLRRARATGDGATADGATGDRGATAVADPAQAGDAALPLEVPTRPTIADGIRIGRPGDRPWRVIREYVDDIVCVGENSVYEAIMHLYERSRLVVEGAGAAGVAALLSEVVTPPRDARVVVLVSGGNVDVGAMEKIIDAYLFESGRRAVFRIKVKDLPGQLARVVSIFERENINIAEIEQPPVLAKPISPEYTVFDICVETEGRSHIPRILRALEGERERMRNEGQEPFEIMRR